MHRVAAVVAAAAVLGGCSGDPLEVPAGIDSATPGPVEATTAPPEGGVVTAPPGTAGRDICALLPRDAAQAALGVAVEEPTLTEFGPDRGNCTYAAADGSFDSVTVAIFPIEEYDATVAATSGVSGAPPEPTDGLGVRAVYFETIGFLVDPGEQPFALHVYAVASDDRQRTAARAAVETALGNL